MTYRYIWGTGTMSKGSDEPFSNRTALLESLPIKDYIDPRASRRFGRLTKMIYIAAHRAISDAGIDDPSTIPACVATCLGETQAALGILEQIHQSKGAVISPALVPNSVHNAALGYLFIGQKNHSEAFTVSQGWLSAEAALATADDMLEMGFGELILAAVGDEAYPEWTERLKSLGDYSSAQKLEEEAFEEGAAALILGSSPCKRDLGLVASGSIRWDGTPDGLKKLLESVGVAVSADTEIRVRKSADGKRLREKAALAFGKTNEEIFFDTEGFGTVQTGPLLRLIEACLSERKTELLLLGAEIDELAYIHWKRK